MSKYITHEGIGAVVATCGVEEEIEKPVLVKMVDNFTVAPCQPGEKFCGVAMKSRNGLAPVQFKGFVNVGYSIRMDLGWNNVLTDAYGGITPNEAGMPVLVVAKHGNSTVTICL